MVGVAIVILSIWPLFQPEFFRVHDYTHAARIVEMAQGLKEGQFPVRWVGNLGYGYGMPLFSFYAPLPYYVGGFLYLWGVGAVLAIKLLYGICAGLTFIGMYLLGVQLYRSRLAGLVAATALSLAPYRAVNFYVRGAVSENWGVMALPWILLGIVRVVRRESYGAVILLGSLVVLFLSHNITTMIFAPFAIIFTLVFWWMHSRRSAAIKSHVSSLGLLLGVGLLSVGLSAFYLFPALIEKDLTHIGDILGGYFHYSQHFLYARQFVIPNWGYSGSQWGPDDGMSFFLGYGQLAAVVMGAVMVVVAMAKRRISRNNLFVWLLNLSLLLLALFFSLERSKPLWDVIAPLQTAQFPWRFMGIAVVFLALLCGQLVIFFQQARSRIIISVLVVGILLLSLAYFRPESFLEKAEALYFTDPVKIQNQMSGILPDYIPLSFQIKSGQAKNAEDSANPDLTPAQRMISCDHCDSKKTTVLVDRAHEKLLRITAGDQSLAQFHVANFPGWQVFVDGQAQELQPDTLGAISVMIPSGEHTVGVQLHDTPVRGWSDMVSALSLIICAALAIRQGWMLRAEPDTVKNKK